MENSKITTIVLIATFSLLLINSCQKGEAPVVVTADVTNITGTSAKSGGLITSEGSSTVMSRGVCWSINNKPTINDFKTIDGAGAGSFSSNMTNLDGATVYYVRAYAINDDGTGYGMVYSFETLGQKPSPSVSNVTSSEPTIVTIRGSVNPNYLITNVWFEYGTTTSYGSKVPASPNSIDGNKSTSVSAIVEGLLPGTIYHCRIMATNSLGISYSSDVTFKTLGQVPTVTTLPTINTALEEAQLIGNVNANYLPSIVSFEYGTTTNYGSSVVAVNSPVSGHAIVSVYANVKGLTEGTTYHYRIVAENSLGKTYGNDLTFVTEYKLTGFVNGGILFYLDATGKHGLVCAPSDQSSGTEWGCYMTNLPGAGRLEIGTGRQNTQDIVNACSTAGIAARICYDLELNGFDDWFLPSRDELKLMYTNLKAKGLGNFANRWYWSSSEAANDDAWSLDFSRNYQFVPNKIEKYNVRAVREF